MISRDHKSSVNAKAILTILLITLSMLCYSQFPIGRNVKSAKTEFINLLKLKGFHLLKQEEVDEDFDIAKFSEEFTVYFGKNSYENVYWITLSTFKKSIYEKLKNIFNFSSWVYIGEFPNKANEIESVYTYGRYRIRMPHPDGAFQFVVNLKDEE
jgi:hypothetical protein